VCVSCVGDAHCWRACFEALTCRRRLKGVLLWFPRSIVVLQMHLLFSYAPFECHVLLSPRSAGFRYGARARKGPSACMTVEEACLPHGVFCLA
jgi:hypothetical protein